MKKLKSFLKPYRTLILLGIICLFIQALLELSLPTLMSKLVNIGIQQNGITETAPFAIDASSMRLMQRFMNEQDKAVVEKSYVSFENANEHDLKQEQYPNAKGTDFALVSGVDLAPVEQAFSKASAALVEMMKQVGKAEGHASVQQQTTENQADSFSKLAFMMQAFADSQPQAVEQAISIAEQIPEKMREQTANFLVKAFYQQLGVDIGQRQTQYILQVGVKMLGFTLLLTAFAITSSFCMVRMGAGVGRDLRNAIFKKVTYFNHPEMDRFSIASLITRSTNDVQQIQTFFSVGFRLLCLAPIMGIGGIIMGVSTSVSLSWILVLALVALLGVIVLLFRFAIPRFKKMQELIDRVNLVVREQLSGMMVVRAFSNQAFMQNRFQKSNEALCENTLVISRIMSLLMPMMMLIMNGVSLLIVWFGGKQIAQSSIQVGDMMAFIQYTMQVIMSFLFISMIAVNIPRASVATERIFEILETKEEIQNPQKATPLPSHVSGEVRFDHVSFCYDGASDEVLHDITFTAKPGEVTAFIGSTGAGKSTLINLLPRLYDVTQGAVLIDGVNVKDFSLTDLRKMIRYVPQKGVLFSGDITSNLSYGEKEIKKEDLQKAAQVAQATEFIERLPEQYEAPISQGGTNVSGGQRQRLSIARALVKKAPIYIFDDTFSALDYKTDARLRAALKQEIKDATVLIVAQRISSIRHAQQIIVLDEGKIVGMGVHEDLMKTCQTYQEIAQSQLSKEELA